MSATAGHPALRQRISEALEAHLLDNSAREVGARLGRAGTTISRRGPDLREWPAEEFLHLAAKVPEIGQATREYLDGEAVVGDATRVDGDLMVSLASIGVTITQAAEAMADRHCDLNEARRLLPIVQQTQALLAQAAKDLAEQIRRGAA